MFQPFKTLKDECGYVPLKHSNVDIRLFFLEPLTLGLILCSWGVASLFIKIYVDWSDFAQGKLITVYVLTFGTISIEESELYPQNAHIVLLLAYSIDGRCAYNFSRGFFTVNFCDLKNFTQEWALSVSPPMHTCTR